MKTIALLAVLFAGNAFADTADDISARVHRMAADREAQYQAVMSRPSALSEVKADPSAYQSSKVDYTIVTLPDGKTASALTFK